MHPGMGLKIRMEGERGRMRDDGRVGERDGRRSRHGSWRGVEKKGGGRRGRGRCRRGDTGERRGELLLLDGLLGGALGGHDDALRDLVQPDAAQARDGAAAGHVRGTAGIARVLPLLLGQRGLPASA